MATNNPSSQMPTLSKVFVGAGLALIFVGIFFREFIFPFPRIGIALLWAGMIFQYYHLWKNGQKEKLREVGFRLLIIFAMVGLLFVLSVLL